jgi:hypothetical protein
MKKLLTLLGLTSLSLSGSMAFVSYLTLSNQHVDNDSLVTPQEFSTNVENQNYSYPQLSAFSNGLLGRNGFSSRLINPQVDLVDITTIITDLNLGSFQHRPTALDILTRLKIMFEDLDETQINAEVIDDTQVRIVVLPDSEVYIQDTLILTYVITETRDL